MKDRDFHISGESYAGKYIPCIADAILDHDLDYPENKKIKLKSLLVGNPYFGNVIDFQSRKDFSGKLDKSLKLKSLKLISS